MISSCSQFFSNKNIGNVILFALQINCLDSLLNILTNLKDCRAPSPVNQAASRCPPLLWVPCSWSGCLPFLRCGHVYSAEVVLREYLFLKIRSVWVIAPQSSVLCLFN